MTRTTENGDSINKVKFIFNCQWKKPDARLHKQIM